MSPAVILAAIVLVPVILLMVLRINATLVFLSLCLGNVLVQFTANDAGDFLTTFSASNTVTSLTTTNSNLKIVLLLFPVVLTTIFMIKTVHGGSRLLLNILPAAGVGLLGALLVVPLLPPGTAYNIIDSSLWSEVQKAQPLIVGSSALVCLLVLWLQRPKAGGHHKRKH
ncbi:MAG TPA: hypothetical protein VD706_03075 [Candidatus Saccharimonadales bacterium]|nr:hypothetical protein [Candidatus Saccharimonadales bacterium]